MYEAVKINKEWRIRSLSPCFKPILLPEVYRTKTQAVRAALNSPLSSERSPHGGEVGNNKLNGRRKEKEYDKRRIRKKT